MDGRFGNMPWCMCWRDQTNSEQRTLPLTNRPTCWWRPTGQAGTRLVERRAGGLPQPRTGGYDAVVAAVVKQNKLVTVRGLSNYRVLSGQ